MTDFRSELLPKGTALSVSSFSVGPVLPFETMAKISPFKFLQEVRAEADKVTWPTRKETLVTGAMVFVMVMITGLFFLVVDQALSFAVRMLLGLGR